MSAELDSSQLGVLCLVPENVTAPWLLFEAGALSKSVAESRLIPLLIDVPVSALAGGPLAQFQATSFERDDMYRLLVSMNELLDEGGISEKQLETTFGVWWPRLEKAVGALMSAQPPTAVAAAAKPAAAGPAGADDLEKVEVQILEELSKLSRMQSMDAEDLAAVLSMSEQRVTYHVEKLDEKDYVHGVYAIGRPPQYILDQKGRELLVRLGLL